MDNIFRTRVLTGAVNMMSAPAMIVYNRFFRGREHMEPSDRLAFDVISGSENLLSNLTVTAPAQVTGKTTRKTITMTAPRLATKRFIHASELNALRAYGSQIGQEMMETRIQRELRDMRGSFDRTVEWWACGALKGSIYDSDLTTVLVDYDVDDSHCPTLTAGNKWSAADSKPIERIRTFQRIIEEDAGAAITGWVALLGSAVMDALLKHSDVLELLKYQSGNQIAENGRITRLTEVEFIEYNASFLHQGQRKRFIDQDRFLLVGLCEDLVDVPYAPVIDSDAPGGVGNPGQGRMFFAKSWDEKDPSGKWIKAEGRPLPVLQRPGAVVYAKVV